MLGAFSWAKRCVFVRPTGPSLGPVCAYAIFWRTQRPSKHVISAVALRGLSTMAGFGARGPAARLRRRTHSTGAEPPMQHDARHTPMEGPAKRRPMLYLSLAPLRPGAEALSLSTSPPVNSAETTGISISRLNHSRRAPKGGRTPHGFAAPQPRPWELPGAQRTGRAARRL